VILAANKAEGKAADATILEAFALGRLNMAKAWAS